MDVSKLLEKLKQKKKEEEIELLDIQASIILLTSCLDYLAMARSKRLDNIKNEIKKTIKELTDE
jgi:hypothetical protein